MKEHVNMQLPRKLFKTVSLSCFLFFFSLPYALAETQYVTIGTGSITGVYYPTGGAVCHLINEIKDSEKIHCEIKSTPGSIYNLAGIRSGELDLGVVQSDWQYHAYSGTSRYAEQGKFFTLRSLFSVHAEPFTVLARADANVNHFEDLLGKRINIGSPRSGQRATMDMLLDLYGWKLQDFAAVSELNPSEQAKALCDDKVDAIIYVVGHPNSSIKEASGACQTKLVNVSGDKISSLINTRSYYRNAVIPGGMYRGSDQDTTTFGVGATIVTTTLLPEEAAYNLVKAVFENHGLFVQLHPAFQDLNKNGMVSDSLTAPLHPGAVRYYKEAGLMK
ncbi:TAXI family TRAP transporter solute-binding subunit [Psychromonas aquimarina]|uniref:TAXI family TRAP transporter solute-binding subunit n=1 Tax=Psychromonas aquimarina TaxID=444919 RepID=UPI00146FA2DB|nr:TAXI family TRAP transporter solute-binding subunit [Psychromonas aquimarina]